MSKLSIFIPVYNQPALARRALSYLVKQSYQDFLVIIQDDAGQADYQSLIKEFPSLPIEYRRHGKNLGAIQNMIYCLFAPSDSEFVMCLHEDDFLQPDYLATALAILEKNSDLAFIGSAAHFFQPGIEPMVSTTVNAGFHEYGLSDFTAFLLNQNKLAFGSLIYRRADLRPGFIDLETYDVLFDRPFLLKILEANDKSGAVLAGEFYYYQNHPFPDKRWDSLTLANVLNLYSRYEFLAPGRGRFITSQYLFNFVNLKHKTARAWRTFWSDGRRAGLISLRRLSCKFLLASLFILAFGQKNYDRLFTFIKQNK